MGLIVPLSKWAGASKPFFKHNRHFFLRDWEDQDQSAADSVSADSPLPGLQTTAQSNGNLTTPVTNLVGPDSEMVDF